MNTTIRIAEREIGPGSPVFVVAELSANHHQRLDEARELIVAAQRAGADAVKLQTYTADTLTLRSPQPWFRVSGATPWQGEYLHDLYSRASTPWQWYAELRDLASEHGLILFSTPFDATAVDFLSTMDAPAFKIASFELVDLPLIRHVAATGRPVILSTGMASEQEIADAVDAFRAAGGNQLALLKCTSAYPAPAQDANLRAIGTLLERFGVPVGLSDHTMDQDIVAAAVALGASIVEKHLTLSRAAGGPDSAFSLEPAEFAAMVQAVRRVEQALGSGRLEPAESEQACRALRRSLFAVTDIAAGEPITPDNVRSLRPGNGLSPKHLDAIIGRRAKCAIERGTPLSWELLD